MDLGFSTSGNATVTVFDRGVPVLVTDPWIEGPQYFGSWTLPYRYSPEQLEAFAQCRYVWLSHGHPDHLNLNSLERLREKVLLIPEHYGGRISSSLKEAGYRVQDVKNGSWLQLSDRIRVLSFSDWNQDAALLIALASQCAVLNLNDGSALGTREALKSQFQNFPRRFVLRLINYGDADMMNYFTEAGERIEPFFGTRVSLGKDYSLLLKDWNATHTAPFSCHHAYARTDSRWAADYETPLEDHRREFSSKQGEFIPGYFSYDVLADRLVELPMLPVPREFHEPAEFGDDWSETLEHGDADALRTYFGKFEHLREKFQFINCKVGGRDNIIDLGGLKGRGITFEAPRTSLMTAIRYEIFDDLLIGNFVKTTLHGDVRSLYPDFTPYVAKYGDNGRAFTVTDLHDYFRAYRASTGFQGWIEQVKINSMEKVRGVISANPSLYLTARRIYKYVKSRS